MTLQELGSIVFKKPVSDKVIRKSLEAGYFPDILEYDYDKDYVKVRELVEEWKKTFVGLYTYKFLPSRKTVLDILTEEFGRFPECSDFTRLGIERIFDILQRKARRGVTQNTLHQYGKDFKSVLNELKFDIELPFNGFNKVLTLKKEDSQFVYLTEEEIARLDRYEPKNWVESYTKKLFMISCYTGCRHSDAERLTMSHVSGGQLHFVTQKTKTNVTMKMKPALRKYLELDIPKYRGETLSILKEMCKKVRICKPVTIYRHGKETTMPKWYFVSPHTARRSFATNLHLRGADINTIRFLMGHADVSMTQGYICAVRKLDYNAERFFD